MSLVSLLVAATVSPAAQAGESANGIGPGAVLLLALGTGATVLALWFSRVRRHARSRAFAEVKEVSSDDLARLDDELHALRDEVDAPGASLQALDDAAAASDAYDRAELAWKRACEPDDLEAVSMAAEEARWRLACAQARLRDDDPPLRRPPCFFDPGHGPSARDVQWYPPYGGARLVPACEADADRVEHGEPPDVLLVPAAEGHVPYYEAGPSYAAYAAGFFGGRARRARRRPTTAADPPTRVRARTPAASPATPAAATPELAQ